MHFLYRFFVRIFGRSHRMEAKLDKLLEQQVIIMGKQDDMTALLNDINAETNDVAAKVDSLELKVGEAITQDQVDLATSIKARLKGIAADPANPVPAPPAEPAAPATT